MARFDGLAGVQHELDLLLARDEPLAANIGRRPGQKEERWASPLVASPDRDEEPEPPPVAVPHASVSQDGPDGAGDVRPASDDLHAELRDLRSEVAALRHELDQLRASLGG